MAHTYNKIESADLANKGNVGMPDTPNLTTEEMQQKLDELPNLIIEKFNTLIDELNEYVGSAIVSSQFNALRFDSDNNLQFSTDGGQTWQSSSSVIQVNVSPEDIHMDNYSKGESLNAIERMDTLNQAIGKVDGRTYRLGDSLPNLIPFPYYETTKTVNGITFTVNPDGTIKANGTATADISFVAIHSNSGYKLSSGTYTLTGCPAGGGNATYGVSVSYKHGESVIQYANDSGSGIAFTIPSEYENDNIAVGVVIKSGVTVNNLVFAPMLVTGTNKPTKYRKFVNPEVYLSQAEYEALPTKVPYVVYNTY